MGAAVDGEAAPGLPAGPRPGGAGAVLVRTVQPWVYRNKSHFAFRWLSERAGAATVDGTLRGLVEKHADDRSPFATALELRDHLARSVPDSLTESLADWWDSIVLHDHRLISARARPSADGAYSLDLRVEAGK